MKIINTKTHGTLDYLTGVVLIVSPWIFKFADGSAAQMVPVILGVMTILMSMLTDYELGIVRKIPMSAHLTIDLFSGIFLAASPWIFGFSDRVFLPHLILGIMEIGVSMMTERTPYHSVS